MKIGITGVSGVLGQQIAAELITQNVETIGFVNSELTTLPIPTIKLDITNELQTDELINDFDLIIHCAAYVSFHKKDVLKMYNVNVIGTKNVINACLQNKIPNFIHISSTAVLDDTSLPIKENNLWNRTSVKTDYAISKYEAELEAWRAQEEGINVATICPGVIIGEGNTNKSSDKLYAIIRNKWNVYPSGTNGFINAKEVAKIVWKIIENQAYGQRYLAVTHNATYKYVLDSIAKKLSLPAPNYKISARLVKFILPLVSFFEWLGIRMPIPSQGLSNSSKKVEYLPEAIYSKLNYTKGNLL